MTTAALLAVPGAAWSSNRPGVGDSDSTRRVPPQPNSTANDFAGLDHLGRQHFTDAIGSAFKVTEPGSNAQPVWLRLLSVGELQAGVPMNPASMAVAPKSVSTATLTTGFLLSFAGTGTQQLPQGTYIFEHDKLGRFGLFVVPGVGVQQTASAVVNRLGTTSASTLPVVGTSTNASGTASSSFAPAPAEAPAARQVRGLRGRTQE
jgi:hypothetical protein